MKTTMIYMTLALNAISATAADPFFTPIGSFSEPLVSIQKSQNGKSHELVIATIHTYDLKGNSVESREIRKAGGFIEVDHYRIPIRSVVTKEGIDGSWYVGPYDLDIRTGHFDKFAGKKVADLFGEYSGYNFNLGILIAGGGKSRLENRESITLTDFNFAVILGPSEGLGINAGLTAERVLLELQPYETVKVSRRRDTFRFDSKLGRVGRPIEYFEDQVISYSQIASSKL